MSSHARRALRPWITAVVGIALLLGFSAIPAAAQPQPGNVPPPRPTPDSGAADGPPFDPSAPTPPTTTPPASAPRSDAGYLGIVGNDRQENGAGVRIVEIETAGPAGNGGLKEDDLITKVNGTPIHSTADMGKVVEPLAVGTQVTFEVDRAGKKQTFQVTLGKRPPADQRRFAQFGRVKEEPPADQPAGEPTPAEQPGGLIGRGLGALLPSNPTPADAAPGTNGAARSPALNPSADAGAGQPGAAQQRRQLLGVRTQPVTEEIRRRLSLPVANGAWVVSRTLGSAAEKAGIPLDAVITAVDKVPVESPRDLSRQVSQAGAGHAIELTYFSEGKFHRATVVLADIAGQAPLTGQGPALAPTDVPAELPAPTTLPPPIQTNPGSQPLAPKSTQAQIQELQRRLDELDERVHLLEQAQRKQ